MDILEHIIFFYKFFRDVGEFDTSIFRAGDMALEVIVLYVKAEKSRSRIRYEYVGNQFDRIEGSIFGTDIAGVDDAISPNGDLHAVFILLVVFEFADDLGVGEFFAAVGEDMPVPCDMKGVSDFNTLQ